MIFWNRTGIITRYQYSHVAISLNKECDVLYSFGRRKTNSILSGGLSIQEKTGEFFTKFNKTESEIYEIAVTDNQYEDTKKVLQYMEKNINIYKYDFFGIILRFFKIPITFKNRYVCSYFVAEVLEKSNIYKFDKQACLVKPKDFENLKGAKKIYSGPYNLYT